jgi:acetyl-CoA C-acetyltransferase
MTAKRTVLICGAQRTAIGSFQGALSSLPAPELGASALTAVLQQCRLAADAIDEVILGCVLTAGVGQAPARQAAMKAGLPPGVQAMTINKVCSSGLKAVMLAAQSVQLGISEAVLAGGMESMSQAPYLLPALRNGARLGQTAAVDSIIKDGLWDVYNDFHMGNAAELCAKEYKLSREDQDAYARESYHRAQQAIVEGRFQAEIVKVPVRQGKSESVVDTDEEPGRAKLEKFSQLKPAFQQDGTVTAANASSLNDGAAALLVCSEAFAAEHGLEPLARIVEQGHCSQAPEWFTTAPIAAVEQLLKKCGRKVEEIDLFEINEAFAVVALACAGGLHFDQLKLNVNGGAVALGHPIGASGARILTTLLYALKHRGLHRGVAAICNGGGEATALLVERD